MESNTITILSQPIFISFSNHMKAILYVFLGFKLLYFLINYLIFN